MPKLSAPRFYEGAVHEFLRYLDSRIDNKEAVLRNCAEEHRPLIKSEIAELTVVRARLEAMLGVPAGTPRFVLTVRADCGVGEFLWTRRCTYPAGSLGGCSGSLMDSESDWMSSELHEAFREWARRFMAWYFEKEERSMDWDAFNAEGRRLAQCLKAEVGPLIKVRYCKSHYDPGNAVGCCLEMEYEPRVFQRGPGKFTR